jgi:hypothetical protein
MSTVRMSKGLFAVVDDDADDARFAADFRSRRIILCVVVAAVRAFFLVGDADDMMILYNTILAMFYRYQVYIYINDVGMIRFSVVDCTPYSLFSVGGGLTGCHCSTVLIVSPRKQQKCDFFSEQNI